MKHRIKIAAALAVSGMAAAASPAFAVSYASNVVKTGTTVSFTLNSPADLLSYSINGGALITLDGSTKGTKTFNLTNANDTFSAYGMAKFDTEVFGFRAQGNVGLRYEKLDTSIVALDCQGCSSVRATAAGPVNHFVTERTWSKLSAREQVKRWDDILDEHQMEYAVCFPGLVVVVSTR